MLPLALHSSPLRHLVIAKGVMNALPAEPDRNFSLQARCC